jgi:hypothetical protein
MSLETWLQNGHLRRHEATVAEVRQLFGLIDRELSDAAVSGLSTDGQFMHAYDAAYQLCRLALHVSGYEVAKGPGHHSMTINSLRFTLGAEQIDNEIYLSKCSRQRNQTLYDYAGVVSAQDAADLRQTAVELRATVLNWLRANHSALLPRGL